MQGGTAPAAALQGIEPNGRGASRLSSSRLHSPADFRFCEIRLQFRPDR